MDVVGRMVMVVVVMMMEEKQVTGVVSVEEVMEIAAVRVGAGTVMLVVTTPIVVQAVPSLILVRIAIMVPVVVAMSLQLAIET